MNKIMKKIAFMLMLLWGVLVSVSLVSCGSDDDEAAASASTKLYGTWVCTEYNRTTKFTFQTNGECSYSSTYDGSDTYTEEESTGTYEYDESAGKLTVTLAGIKKTYSVSGTKKTLSKTDPVETIQIFTGVKVTGNTIVLDDKVFANEISRDSNTGSKILGTWVNTYSTSNGYYYNNTTTVTEKITFSANGKCEYSVTTDGPQTYNELEETGAYQYNENTGALTVTLAGVMKTYSVSGSGSKKTLQSSSKVGFSKTYKSVTISGNTASANGKTYTKQGSNNSSSDNSSSDTTTSSTIVGTWVNKVSGETTTITFSADGKCTHTSIQDQETIYAIAEMTGVYKYNASTGTLNTTLSGTQLIYNVSDSKKTLTKTKTIGGNLTMSVKISGNTAIVDGATYTKTISVDGDLDNNWATEK